MTSSFRCNICKSSILDADHRYHCRICSDYDLCNNCMETNLLAKEHQKIHERSTLHFFPSLNIQDLGVRTLVHITDIQVGEKIVKEVRFKPGCGGNFGPGIYFAETEDVARKKTLHGAGKNFAILTVKVNLGKSVYFNDGMYEMKFTESDCKHLGCDTVKQGDDSFLEYVIFDPKRVKIVSCKAVWGEKISCFGSVDAVPTDLRKGVVSFRGREWETREEGYRNLFHATSIEAGRSIIESRFRPGREGIYGGAIYLADTQERALQVGRFAQGIQKSVLRVRANVGRCIVFGTTFPDFGGSEALAALGCDSVYGTDYNLYAFYDPSRIEVVEQIVYVNEDELTKDGPDSFRPHPSQACTITPAAAAGGGATCVFKEEASYRAVFLKAPITQGIVRWTIKYGTPHKALPDGSYPPFTLGVLSSASLGSADNTRIGHAKGGCGFGFWGGTWSTLEGIADEANFPVTETVVPENSVVAVEADVSARTLAFFVNDKKVPHVIVGIPVPFHFGVSVHSGCSFESVSLDRLSSPTPSLVGFVTHDIKT